MSLTDALKTLSDAHGPHALVSAFHALQGNVRRLRKASQQQWGNLAQTYQEAMRLWDADKLAGVSRAERIARLEKSLRAAWPPAREWHYFCVACGDTGLELSECGGLSDCGRTKAHLPHTYGRACLCAKGSKFSEKPKPEAADYKSAGFTKVGKR